MDKCISCQKNEGVYKHFHGGHVCEKCVGDFFSCPDCGNIFDMDDFDNGDAGNGFCAKDTYNH